MSRTPHIKVHTMKIDKDPFKLGNLPQLDPPSDGWPEIKAALDGQFRRRHVLKSTAASLAVAASFAAAIGLVVFQPWKEPLSTDSATPVISTQQESGSGSVDSDEQAVESLIVLSQRLESGLRQIRSEQPQLPLDTVVYQVELEDMVAQVDEALSRDPDSPELWRQRVNLMLDLTRLYRNELRRESARMASL